MAETGSREARLAEFIDWAKAHIKGDEKGEAQVFCDHIAQLQEPRQTLEKPRNREEEPVFSPTNSGEDP